MGARWPSTSVGNIRSMSPVAVIDRLRAASWLRGRRMLVVGGAALAAMGLGLGLGLTLTGGGSPGSGSTSGASSAGTRGRSAAGGATALGAAGIPVPTTSTRSCRASDISLDAGPSTTDEGHTGMPLIVTNRSTTPCAVAGYPTVDGYNSSGHLTATALALPSGFVGGIGPNGTPQPIIIGPGQTASAMVEAESQQPASPANPSGPPGGSTPRTTRPRPSCTTLTALKVILPRDTASTTVSLNLVDCSAFLIHPFVAGTSGSGT